MTDSLRLPAGLREDLQECLVQLWMKCTNTIRVHLGRETVNEIRGIEDPIRVQELMKQHDYEQHVLQEAIKIVAEFTGIEY